MSAPSPQRRNQYLCRRIAVGRQTLFSQMVSHPLEAHAEADARRRRPSDLLDQTVVTATSEDRDLRTVGLRGDNLEDRVGCSSRDRAPRVGRSS